MPSQSEKVYAITILGHRKDGMSKDEYHEYISNVHAGHLKALLAKNDIISYTMHNTSTTMDALTNSVYGGYIQQHNIEDCDAVIQIVFKDVEDYLRVRNDDHFKSVVGPDHANFANVAKTKFSMGWHEIHLSDGKIVS